MVGFAIAHSFTFTYKEYLPSTIEEAMAEYEYEQVAAVNNGSNEGNGGGNGEDRHPAYNPPETLSRPLKFKDAFWSSTIPSDISHDIRRLQNGVDKAVSQINNPGTISLQDIPVGEEDDDPLRNFNWTADGNFSHSRPQQHEEHVV